MTYIKYQCRNSKVSSNFDGYRFHPLNWVWLNHKIGIIKFRKMIKELKDLGIWDKTENMMIYGYWIKR